jgi:hypothetical protein
VGNDPAVTVDGTKCERDHIGKCLPGLVVLFSIEIMLDG